MQDLIYLAIVIAFFALMALFTVACDRIIGPDDVSLEMVDETDEPDDELVAA